MVWVHGGDVKVADDNGCCNYAVSLLGMSSEIKGKKAFSIKLSQYYVDNIERNTMSNVHLLIQ